MKIKNKITIIKNIIYKIKKQIKKKLIFESKGVTDLHLQRKIKVKIDIKKTIV